MPIRLDRLSSTEILALDKTKSIVFLCVSALEDHGPHLPLNADILEAESLAERVALQAERAQEGYQVLFYPSATLARDTSTSRFAVRVRGHVLRDYLIDVCGSLHRMGFRHFVCFTGTPAPAQLTAIEEAGAWFRRRRGKLFKRSEAPTLVSASSVALDELAKSENPFWMNPREHGAARDTSVVLAIDPQAVRSSYTGLPPYHRLRSGLARWIDKKSGKVEGYWGSPAEALAEKGRALLDDRAKELYPKLKAVWTGGNPLTLFKSWYSVFPTNRTLFPIWILFVGLLVLAALWLGSLLQAVSQNVGR